MRTGAIAIISTSTPSSVATLSPFPLPFPILPLSVSSVAALMTVVEEGAFVTSSVLILLLNEEEILLSLALTFGVVLLALVLVLLHINGGTSSAAYLCPRKCLIRFTFGIDSIDADIVV